MSKTKLYLMAFVAFIIAAKAHAQVDPGYYITKYVVEATVHEDNTISVKENIDVDFTLESHGIYRMIPTWTWVKRDVSKQQDGSETKLMHYQSVVTNVKTSEEWTDLSDEYSELFAMRFGVFERTYTGPHSYEISYDYTFYGDRIPESDVLFFSVLGSGWDCGTEQFVFKIHFDKPLSDKELAGLQLFTGKLGSKENGKDEYIKEATRTYIEGEVCDISPRNAVTVFVPLHEGYFTGGEHPAVEQNTSWGLLAASFLLMFIVLYAVICKKKDIITKVISFYPPQGCSSAEVGTLIDNSVDDQDIISLIPWFAQQGYLTIDNAGEHPILSKVKDLPEDAPTYQKKLFNGFFSGDRTSFNLGKVDKSFGKAWLESKESATSNFKDKLNNIEIGKFMLLLCAIIAVACFNSWSCIGPDSWLAGILTAGCFFFLSFIQISASDSKQNRKAMAFVVIIDILIMVVFWGAMFLFAWDGDDPTYIPLTAIIPVNVVLNICCLYAIQMSHMTKYRRERIGEILGLHEFISTAEKQQLEHLQAEDEKYFYNILPYAVAFGMANKWAKKFEGIKVEPVDWYNGNPSSPITYGLANMSTDKLISSSLQKAIAAEMMARQEAAVRSSGGSSHSSAGRFSTGGGGFSGGGFGGGGGGRW